MPPFEMEVCEVFRLKDGRVVLAGRIEGSVPFIGRSLAEVWVDDEKRSILRIDGEMIAAPTGDPRGSRLRAVSTMDTRCLDRESIAEGQRWRLRFLTPDSARNLRQIPMHRYLIGLDDPPPEFVSDPMTLGPVLPEGWDGDAWVSVGRPDYFLRAWNKARGRVAYGRASTYEEARRHLLQDVSSGTRRVVVESASG